MIVGGLFDMKKRLLAYSVKYQGEFNKISEAVWKEEPYEKNIVYKGNYVTLLDKEYPHQLMPLKYKPWVLFYEGNLSLLKQEMVTVIGSRKISENGKRCTNELITNLRDNYVIVSGLAKGVDGYAHTMALEKGRNTIAVIGSGIDVHYPKENDYLYHRIIREGLIISEYPFGTRPYAYHFPWRNRILAALGKAVIVVEANKQSGTMITVNEALELGKEIYCFPHGYFDSNGTGCNMLIMEGCNIIHDLQQIKEI